MTEKMTVELIDKKAEDLKNKILNSLTALECTGTAYYVSNSGSDDNDGLTPLTPWKTLQKVSDTAFSCGDVVYLERGSLFRERLTLNGDGMAVSAYGTGDKPKIYGSDRNYNQPSDWLPTAHDNLYCCCDTFADDVGLIVFNDGESCSLKQLIGNFGFKGGLEELNEDLYMYYCEETRKLYLYSSEGHPSERFSSVEICKGGAIVGLMTHNIVVDNLCIKYGSGHGIAGMRRNGITVQNCEMGWIGGMLQYKRIDGSPVRYGNAIEVYACCKDYKMCDNYIYQIYDAAVTHQYFQDTNEEMYMEDVVYSGNLIEYCTYSLEYALAKQTNGDQCMRNILVTDNIMRFAGYGFGNQRPDKETPAHIKSWDTENTSENYVIKNNIFDRSRYMVVHVAAVNKEHLPVMSGNVYVQNKDGQLGRYGVVPTSISYFSEAPDFYEFDSEAQVILV